MMGYYLPQYNFSVMMHNGAWCQFVRQHGDMIAATKDQIDAVESWARSNREKYEAAKAD